MGVEGKNWVRMQGTKNDHSTKTFYLFMDDPVSFDLLKRMLIAGDHWKKDAREGTIYANCRSFPSLTNTVKPEKLKGLLELIQDHEDDKGKARKYFYVNESGLRIGFEKIFNYIKHIGGRQFLIKDTKFTVEGWEDLGDEVCLRGGSWFQGNRTIFNKGTDWEALQKRCEELRIPGA